MATTKRAKLGMRIEGSARPEDDSGPAPGSKAFGERARRRKGQINPKRRRVDVFIQEDQSLKEKVLTAKRKRKAGEYVA